MVSQSNLNLYVALPRLFLVDYLFLNLAPTSQFPQRVLTPYISYRSTRSGSPFLSLDPLTLKTQDFQSS
jgi:hypothetical protein